jgi:hypothetical protein
MACGLPAGDWIRGRNAKEEGWKLEDGGEGESGDASSTSRTDWRGRK